MPMDSISMCSTTLYMSNVDKGSWFKGLSAYTMRLCQNFDSSSDLEPQPLIKVVWVELFENTAICPWTAYQCAQTLCICLMQMHRKQFEEAVSLNHDKMTSFWLHKGPRTPKYEPSSVGTTVWGYCHMPMDSIIMCSNTLNIFNMDFGSS
jgi:hypothetical protein